MMKAVNSSRINGTVDAPASKSVMIRVVAAALLAHGTSRISHPTFCSDSVAALEVADSLGALIDRGKDGLSITGNGGLQEREMKETVVNCGESGLCMRMFAPITATTEQEIVLEAEGSLRKRPMTMVEDLARLGAVCKTSDGYPPITIKGPIKGGPVHIDGYESSQFLTGLLMALPLCRENSAIAVSRLKSKPYVTMTMDTLTAFGISIHADKELSLFEVPGGQSYRAVDDYAVEGDWSGAAFLLVAGAIAGKVKVKGLDIASFQADKAVMEALAKAGAEIDISSEAVSVARKDLKAFEFNALDCPDLVPPLTALAANCDGKSVIFGIERLVHKESNRSATLASEFTRMGIRIGLFRDRMEIYGGRPTGDIVNAHNDHRIAMACAVTALTGQRPVVIEGAESVAKSYPQFFEDLDSLREAQ